MILKAAFVKFWLYANYYQVKRKRPSRQRKMSFSRARNSWLFQSRSRYVPKWSFIRSKG